MKIPCFTLVLSFLLAGAQAATVNFVQNARNDANGTILDAVSSNTFNTTGISYTTETAPSTYLGFRFTRWTNSDNPATAYRDAWGRSINPISFTLLEDTTATARYLPEALDSDGDQVPDWYEIEFYGILGNAAVADTDGDGFTQLQEFQNGTHVLFPNETLAGGVSAGSSGLVTVNLGGFSRYTLRSVPAGIVNQNANVQPGTVVMTPDLLADETFAYWSLDGVRQQDAWGRAQPQISFTVGAEDREAVAYLFEGDTDEDSLPDAYEQYYFGSLTNGALSDTDGDGISLLAERSGGTNPLYANTDQEGGVSWSDSVLVTVNFVGHSYTITSNPAGTVNQSAIVQDGSVITTPDMTQSTFGYWEVDGVRQLDAWGVALRQVSFTVNGAARTTVAHLFADDSDSDGINDGYEQYHFGTLTNAANSDTDGDGISLLAEYTSGGNPLYGNNHQEGGVSWADSPQIVVNLQPFERLSKVLIGGVFTNFFSPNPDLVTGIQTSAWSATAMTDWDGDGDLDLFIAHESGLRVFRNIGTARNPNFEEITSGFAALVAYVTSVDQPSLTGGDWNGDGLGDLVIGGNTGTLRLIASGGEFSSSGSGLNFTVVSTRTSPALSDMNGDGRADLIVLLDDGTARLFLNNGTSSPFSGSGSANFLGTPATAGISIATGDINQDSLPDVLLSDNDGRIWEFINNGSGGFSLQSKVWAGSYPGFAAGLTLAAADLEGDGDLDLIGGLANGGLIALRDPSVGRPTGLIARPGASSVQLDWDANWQSRIRGYLVYRSASLAGPWNKLVSDYVPLPSYLDSSFDSMVLNYYHVTGVSYFFLPGNSTPRVVESLPSDPALTQGGKVILSVRPARGNPGQKIKINLSIENATGVSGNGMQLSVAYDPTKLQPWAQADPGEETVLSTGLSRDLTFTDNGTSANGQWVINGSGGLLEPGAGKLFTLQFKVAGGLPIGTKLGISLSGATMRDLNSNPLTVEISAQAEPESGNTFTEGDVNGDGLLSSGDKEQLKALAVRNLRPPTAEELMAGDLNGNGQLDAKDFVLLTQLLNGP